VFSEHANPAMAPVALLAVAVRAQRQPADAGNPFLRAECQLIEGASVWLDTLRKLRDAMDPEIWFEELHGSPRGAATAST
jgi:hypothetical protein